MAKAAIVVTTTDTAMNKIASNLFSFMSHPILKADVNFVSTYAKMVLSPNLLWDQTTDPNVGEPGFLTFHRLVRFFLNLQQLEDLKAKLAHKT